MTEPDAAAAADLDPTALPAYLDVIVADDEGTLRILGAGDTPEHAMQALREHLTSNAAPVPVHAVYHSFALARGIDGPELRYLIAVDPTAHAFYTLGRQDERVAGSEELRELGDERVRRAALERTLRDVRAGLFAGHTHDSDPGHVAIDSALDLIDAVLPPAPTDEAPAVSG